MSNIPHIAVLIMAKNETKRLHVTLNSIKDFAGSLVFYDTGSEDDTIKIAEDFCTLNNIPFRLLQGEFKNFAESRNISLDFADTFDDIDYILLLDTNDELRNSDKLIDYCKKYWDKPNTGFLLSQEWWSGKYDKYFNIRLVKARQTWRYFGRVHEWIKNTRYENDDEAKKAGDIVIKIYDVVIYQDRTKDDNKSAKRFFRDKELLLEDHNENPKDTRTVFYLAQTYSCLGEMENSFKYYKMRSEMTDGFWEERFHSYLRCGELLSKLDKSWDEIMMYYMKSYEIHARAEPLVRIVEYYKDKNWLLCFTFAELACKLTYPDCLLFVDKRAYDYKRWHLLGIAGWYANEFEKGKIGCLKAVESNLGQEVDKNNLKFYLEREEEQKKKNREIEISNLTEEFKSKYPNLSNKQIRNKVMKKIKK